MTMFIIYAEPYQITTKKYEVYDRLKLYIKNEKTGELVNFHDISFRSTPKQIYDVLTELGYLKTDDANRQSEINPDGRTSGLETNTI